MPDTSTFILFIGAALVLLLTPGPAVVYIVARSVEQGRRAGMVSATGMSVGTLFHVAAAALGLSALLASSVIAFNILKYAGAVYLVYLGLKKLFFTDKIEEHQNRGGESLKSIFAQAVVVNLFNPKTSLFFVAFLPQFIDPAAGPVAGQVLVFGITLAIMGLCSDNLYALAAASVRRFFGGRASALPRYLSGSVYIALGFVTAFTSLQRSK